MFNHIDLQFETVGKRFEHFMENWSLYLIVIKLKHGKNQEGKLEAIALPKGWFFVLLLPVACSVSAIFYVKKVLWYKKSTLGYRVYQLLVVSNRIITRTPCNINLNQFNGEVNPFMVARVVIITLVFTDWIFYEFIILVK